jgi:hypothetical protein
MTDNITLPRAVVEKLRASFKVVHGTITETGWALDCREELAVIDAALAEPKKVTPSTPVQYGWLCPACGRGNAPLAQTCSCKGWPSLQITCGPATMTGGT